MLGVPSVPDVGAVPRGGRPVPAGTAVLRGFLLASAGLGVHGWGVVGERAGGFGDQTGGGVARGVVRSVDPGVAAVGPAKVGPYPLGLEAMVGAAEAAEIVAGGVAAALGVGVVEGDDVVEIGLLRRGGAAGEDTRAVATATEEGNGVRWSVAPGGVGIGVGEVGEVVGPDRGAGGQLCGGVGGDGPVSGQGQRPRGPVRSRVRVGVADDPSGARLGGGIGGMRSLRRGQAGPATGQCEQSGGAQLADGAGVVSIGGAGEDVDSADDL